MSKTPAEEMMERETRIAYGPVPHSLFGEPLPETSWQLRGPEFLLRGAGDHYFHYRVGQGIIVERGADIDLSEERLWLNGSVNAAIASLNGLLPIHASAVEFDGCVYAFTGPPGAGKSTVIAALGARGFPMFCDDTLVLDLSDADVINCLPGHKRLKLTAEAIALTGAPSEEKVSRTVEKFYARSVAGDVGVALPLAKLIFLEEGPDMAITPISGAERFVRMQDEHYTAHLFAVAQDLDSAGHFKHFSRLARQIPMVRFVRPRDTSQFHESVASVAQYISDEGGAQR